MTEKLKTLLHERANRPEFHVPDVELLVRAGTVRARRRRLTVVAGGVAVAAVVGGLAFAGTNGDGRGTDPAGGTGTAGLTWATGSTLHTPDGDLDLGHPVAAYVRTSVGYVFTDGTGGVFSVVEDSVTRVGDIADRSPRLVADGDGPLVGWVDPTEDTPRFVFFDQSAGMTAVTAPGAGDPASIYAIDGRTAYWRDSRGAVAVDIDSGEARVLDGQARNRSDLLAVEDGVIAFDAGDAGTAVGTAREDAVMLPDAYGKQAAFSPDATWISVDADEPLVYEVRTGKRVDLDVDGRWFATGYEWLDERTLAMLSAEDEEDPADLLTCDVAEGVCEVAAADLGTFEELADGFALPVGSLLGD